MHYDYSQLYDHAKAIGLYVDQPALVEHDAMFKALGLTQEQAIAVMLMHFDRMVEVFNAKQYPLKARAQLAAHFLLGRSLQPKE